jgi:hypothetical protein
MLKDKEFSSENKNMEIIVPEEMPAVKKADDAVIVNRDGLDVKKGGNIIIGTLNIFADKLKERHQKHYQGNVVHLVMDIILAFILLSVIASAIWLFVDQPWKKDFSLNIISQNEEIASGRLETFEIDYRNDSEKNLSQSNFALIFPDNFELQTVSPANLFSPETNTLKFGDLNSGANGRIIVKGIVFGAPNDSQKMAVVVSYTKTGVKRYQAKTFDYVVKDSSLKLNWSLPQTLYQGAEFKSVMNIENLGDASYEKLEISVNGDLAITSAVCAKEIKIEKNKLILNNISPGEKMSVELSFVPEGQVGERKINTSMITYKRNQLIPQAVLEHQAVIEEYKLGVSWSGPEGAISAGSRNNYKLIIKNNDDAVIKNINVVIKNNNSNYSMSLVKSSVTANCSIKGENFFIKELDPGSEAILDLIIAFDRKSFQPRQNIVMGAEINSEVEGQKFTVKSQYQGAKFISELDLKSGAYYYSPQGDQLGIGPMPPIVGIPTKYWVIWKTKNQGNELKNFSIRGTLPANVSFADKKSLLAGDLYYDSHKREVVWTIDDIADNSNASKAAFEIQFIPTASDQNHISNLLQNLNYEADDVFAGEKISGNLKNLTTNLDFDSLSKGKGRVVGE